MKKIDTTAEHVTCSAVVSFARNCVRVGRNACFFNFVDLINRLEVLIKLNHQGRVADALSRVDLVILDELGYLPFAQSGGQRLFHLVNRLYERSSTIVTA